MAYMNQGFLDACREEFKRGNKWALMQAVWVCATDGIPLPDWVCQAYIKAYENCRTAKVKSWDDVFGKPWPKGTHQKAVHKRQTKMWPLYNQINAMKEANPALVIDDGLFEKIGKDFNIGKTLASEFYYDAKRLDKKYS